MSYDSDVAAATSGHGEADWDQIIKLCNRIRDSVGQTSMHQAMLSVMKRVKHSSPNVQLQALTLLEACVSNCGQDFQLEITKPYFQSDIKAILTGSYSDPRVTQRVKDLLVSWANEFKSNSKMSGLIRFLEQLHKDGINFQGMQQPVQSSSSRTTTSGGVSRSQEEDDLQKAIRLSLQETSAHPPPSTSSHVHSQPRPKKDVKKVRAVYDFVAAEDNELSFRAGEIITVLDDSDENWWRGETQLSTGLFPASFVSTDLSADPEPSKQQKKKEKKVKKGKGGGKAEIKKVEINEEKVDLLLDMLRGADVTEENQAENETLAELEEQCRQMKPAAEESVASLQRQEEEMLTVNQKFQEALAMYRKLLAEGPRLSAAVLPPRTQAQPPAHPTPHPHPSSLPPSQPPHYLPSSAAPPHTLTSHQAAYYGPEVSVSHNMQVPVTQSQPQAMQAAYGQVYQPQPMVSHPQLMTGGYPNALPPSHPPPPPYQPALYQPPPVQNTLLQQPLL